MGVAVPRLNVVGVRCRPHPASLGTLLAAGFPLELPSTQPSPFHAVKEFVTLAAWLGWMAVMLGTVQALRDDPASGVVADYVLGASVGLDHIGFPSRMFTSL